MITTTYFFKPNFNYSSSDIENFANYLKLMFAIDLNVSSLLIKSEITIWKSLNYYLTLKAKFERILNIFYTKFKDW